MKDSFNSIEELTISNLTFEEDSSSILLEKLELIWRLNMKITSFQQCYSFLGQDSKTTFTGYILQLDISEAETKLIEHSFCGKFVDYRDLDDLIKSTNKNIDCIEAYITVIDEQDKIYGIAATELI